MLFQDPILILYLIPVALLSLSFHEFSHAFFSYKMGDPTAKNLGRLTLNPLKHLDILGTILILLKGFGWAKPVPINPTYYKDRKRGTMLVSLAGPLSNVFLALLFFIPMVYLEGKYGIRRGSIYSSFNLVKIIYGLSYVFYYINIRLAAFNIIPVPPLDGSKILSGILPQRHYYKMLEYENYISMGFLLIMFVFPGVFEIILSPITWGLESAINYIVSPIVNMLI